MAGDVLGQNRDAIIAEPGAFEQKLTGTIGGRRDTLSTDRGQITQVYPSP